MSLTLEKLDLLNCLEKIAFEKCGFLILWIF